MTLMIAWFVVIPVLAVAAGFVATQVRHRARAQRDAMGGFGALEQRVLSL